MASDYVSNLPMPLKVERYLAVGMTPEEATYAADYQGSLALPGLERARMLYMRGYSCDQIAKSYPTYTRRMLLAARGTFGWDQMRIDEAIKAAQAQMVRSGVSQPTGLNFMNGVIESVNQKYEKATMDYLTDPENFPFPEVSKADFERIKNAIELTREILGFDKQSKESTGSNRLGPTINIVLKEKEIKTIEVDQDEVADAMIAEMRALKEAKRFK